MKALIEEINEKLSFILSSLEGRKYEVEDALSDVQDKIDDKIEEAKGYKVDVDAAKEEIKKYEDEIEALENDLSDLTARFSNKDLNAILETGNKEINNQIIIKQKEIAKQREKIAEYTEKARMIKDLLISLKRDKETKKAKLVNLNAVYEYYSTELNRIMDFASDNPDNLVIERVTNEESKDGDYEFKNEPIVDDKPIFDAIKSIENDEDIIVDNEKEDNTIKEEPILENKIDLEEVKHEEPTVQIEESVEHPVVPEEEAINIFDNEINDLNTKEETNYNIFENISKEETNSDKNELSFENNVFNESSNLIENSFEEPQKDIEANIFDDVKEEEETNLKENQKLEEPTVQTGADLLNEFSLFDEDVKERTHEEDLYKDNDNITDLFASDSKDSFDSFDFKALSDSIDREYENIFGNSEEIKLVDEDDNFNLINEEIKDEDLKFDFFGNDEPVEDIVNNINNEKTEITYEEIVNFFKNNNIEFDKFSKEEQEKLKANYDLISYTKTLDILRKNNIRLELIYGAAKIFEMEHNELENVVNKLLIAGQSTLNISYVLGVLPYIKAKDLQEVIDSYGGTIRDANITDLVIKAKHLNELGGGNN